VSDNGGETVKDALNKDHLRVKAGPHAPKVATCPACGGTVDLRSRRTGKSARDRTWFYRHRRGEGVRCTRRSRFSW
jgi:hypothetical protein